MGLLGEQRELRRTFKEREEHGDVSRGSKSWGREVWAKRLEGGWKGTFPGACCYLAVQLL